MPTATPSSSHSLPASWGLALAATSVLLIGGGAVIWAHRGPDQQSADEAGFAAAASAASRPYPDPIDDAVFATPAPGPAALARFGSKIHSVEYAVENGTPVLKIRVVAGGDELVVDAATGRLIETRPSSSTTPVPASRVTGPRASAI